MSDHLHATVVPGCWRCDLSQDEVRELARRVPVQSDPAYSNGREAKPRGTVAWWEHEKAARDYNLHYSQSAERLAERGGFGYWEMTGHLGHEPTTWLALSTSDQAEAV